MKRLTLPTIVLLALAFLYGQWAPAQTKPNAGTCEDYYLIAVAAAGRTPQPVVSTQYAVLYLACREHNRSVSGFH